MTDKVTKLVDHYFREEYGKIVSYLTAKYGADHLAMAEDAVQEALLKAMQTWPFSAIPNNPSGWIATVASNKMIDHLRKKAKNRQADILSESYSEEAREPDMESIPDDMVKMMFACCHPTLSVEYQIILTLKILGGLSVKEIARALLKKEETVAKGYTRARKKFQQENIPLLLPPKAEIKKRLGTVLHIIYLLFNEGYKITEGHGLVKKELCDEAIRLNGILLANEACNTPATNALMSLMYFHASRFEARTDTLGRLITLENQDRKAWNQHYIEQGISYLERATTGAFLNSYYLQAAISGLHCRAARYADTRWTEILQLYDILIRINPTPVARLNRVVVLAKARSVDEALSNLEEIEKKEPFVRENHLYYAIKGDLLSEKGQHSAARKALLQAVALAKNHTEREYLKRKLEENHKD